MSASLQELNSRIAELKYDLEFIALATQLRPRITDVIQWQAVGEVLELTKRFIRTKSRRPEGVYGPLMVRLLGAFERYLRSLVIESLNAHVAAAKKFDDLPEGIGNRNLVLTGRVLASIDSPREHLRFDTAELIANLASCRQGSTSYRLNPPAFSAVVVGVGPDSFEKALKTVNITEWWDAVGKGRALAQMLNTKGPRATGERAQERLKELWRWRNNLAHGGDDEVGISETMLHEAINFVSVFSGVLDEVVLANVKAA